MVGHTEVMAGLTKLAILATRRVGEDQLRQLADQWVEGLRDVEPYGFRRAVKSFGDEGKWPPLGEFRQRAKASTPSPMVTGAAPPDDPTCPQGHTLIIREYINANGRMVGGRHWCPCEDRADALYGTSWGKDVVDPPDARARWRDILLGVGVSGDRGGEPVTLGQIVRGDAWEGDDSDIEEVA